VFFTYTTHNNNTHLCYNTRTGWCYDEASCFARASTTLGSNKTWPGEAASMGCNPSGTMNSARLFYGDGASRSGHVEAPVSVPGNPTQQMWFRGAKSFDSALDLLLALGMSQAELIVFTGGSAGGLTVFLHLDHVAARMATEAPNARVVSCLGPCPLGCALCAAPAP
jgi:hypothetical protein